MGAFIVNLVLVVCFGFMGGALLVMLLVGLAALFYKIRDEWAENWKLILAIGGVIGAFLFICFIVAWFLTFYVYEGGVMGS